MILQQYPRHQPQCFPNLCLHLTIIEFTKTFKYGTSTVKHTQNSGVIKREKSGERDTNRYKYFINYTHIKNHLLPYLVRHEPLCEGCSVAPHWHNHWKSLPYHGYESHVYLVSVQWCDKIYDTLWYCPQKIQCQSLCSRLEALFHCMAFLWVRHNRVLWGWVLVTLWKLSSPILLVFCGFRIETEPLPSLMNIMHIIAFMSVLLVYYVK